jgi:hypothetical protein
MLQVSKVHLHKPFIHLTNLSKRCKNDLLDYRRNVHSSIRNMNTARAVKIATMSHEKRQGTYMCLWQYICAVFVSVDEIDLWVNPNNS